MPSAEHMGFDTPDEVREMPLGRAELITIGGGKVMRMTLQPGWKWSEHVKPLAGTELCEAPHFQYSVSGRIGVRMSDGIRQIGGHSLLLWSHSTMKPAADVLIRHRGADGKGDNALYQVFKLAHVAAPLMAQQHVHRPRCQYGSRLAAFL